MTTVKITELSDIGANLASSTVVPVVNMAGTPITQKTNVGNIANLILEGAGVDYPEATVALLAQTVSNAAQPNITSVGTLTNVVISGNATVNGNITSNGTAYVGNLSTTGVASITTLDVGASANLGAIANVIITGGTIGQILSTDGEGNLSWTSDATTYGNSNVVSLLSAFGSNTITTTGNISGGNVLTSAQVIANGIIDSGTGLTTGGYLSVDGNTDLHNTVVTGNLSATGNITANNLGNISAINLTGSNSNVLYGNGVFAPAAGGANTGNVTFNDINIIGTGNLHLQPDPANTGSYLDIFLTSGPDLHLVASAAANLILGKDDGPNVMTSWDGNVYVQSWNTGSNTQGGVWAFGEDGNFILANGNGVIQSIANSSLDPTLPNVSTMVLTPDANYNSQVLVLDPTAPGHIHLRAYAFSNIDEPAANIFLGGEDTAFEITSGANNQAVIHSNGKAWTFGDDGNISSDTLTFTTTFANVKTVEYQTAGVWDLYVEDSITGSNTAISRLNVSFKDNLIDKPQVYIENTKESDGIALRWTFDENGNLNLPGNLVIAGNTSVFGTNASLLQTTDDLPLIALSSGANGAVSSIWVEDVANVGTSNIAAVYANPTVGSGIVRIAVGQNGNAGPNLWDFDANGNLTLPTGGQIIVSGGLVSSGASPAPTINGFSITNSVDISGNGNIAGNNISATGNISANNFTGNGGTLSNVATKVEGSWTLAAGVNTVNISVPLNGTYALWVNGNIPNGIITYTATAVITNTNVPVLGEQYAWYYAIGNALVFTSIPDQFVGTAGSISNVNTYVGNTANVFTFGITNNSGNTAVVNYGYTKL